MTSRETARTPIAKSPCIPRRTVRKGPRPNTARPWPKPVRRAELARTCRCAKRLPSVRATTRRPTNPRIRRSRPRSRWLRPRLPPCHQLRRQYQAAMIRQKGASPPITISSSIRRIKPQVPGPRFSRRSATISSPIRPPIAQRLSKNKFCRDTRTRTRLRRRRTARMSWRTKKRTSRRARRLRRMRNRGRSS